MQHAIRLAEQADTILVVGCSLVVAPANQIPQLVQMHGGKVIVINTTVTVQDQYADVMLQGKAGEILPQLVQMVRQKLKKKRRRK